MTKFERAVIESASDAILSDSETARIARTTPDSTDRYAQFENEDADREPALRECECGRKGSGIEECQFINCDGPANATAK